MASRQDTKLHIIQTAIIVLKSHGAEQLTMRKIANEAGMSLGNLQYHYKNKTLLLAGLAEYYFNECLEMLDDYQITPKHGTPKRKLKNLILFMIGHFDHISDMCRIFRELWALSTRDEQIHMQMNDYYKMIVKKLSMLLTKIGHTEQASKKIACLLIPYFEGYSITVQALPQNKKQTADMLTELCMTI